MNNLPTKYNFWKKIKTFFYNIFSNKKKYGDNLENNFNDSNKSLKSNSSCFDELKNSVTIFQNKNDIIDSIQKNPDILKNLSSGRLEQLESIYDEKINESIIISEQLDRKIEKLEIELNKA